MTGSASRISEGKSVSCGGRMRSLRRRPLISHPDSRASRVHRSQGTRTNAAAESLNSLYKKELIEREGPWAGTADVKPATLEWVAWYNRERLHSACGYVPPEEFEEKYSARQGNLVNESCRQESATKVARPGRVVLHV